MLKTRLKTYILALSLILLNSRQSYAQYCQADAEGKISVIPQLLELPPDIQTDYVQVAKEFKAIGQNVVKLKEEILIFTPSKSTKNLLPVADYKKQLFALKTRVLSLVEKIPLNHRIAAHSLIEGYFEIANRLLLLEILESPARASMSQLQNEYSLKLSNSVFEKLYPLGMNLSEGLEAKLLNNAATEISYALSFSGENIFRALVRGAAQSPKTRKNNSAYLETVRCGLNRMLIGKIKINQSLLGRDSEKLSIPDQTKVCLNTNAQDFENLSKSDVNVRKEQLLRTILSQEFPQMLSDLSKETIEIFTKTRLGEYIAQFRMFPDWLVLLNANRSEGEPEVSDLELKQAILEIDAGIEREYKRIPVLTNFRGFWAEKEMANIFNQILSSCQYSLTNAMGQNIDKELIVKKLIASEDFYFFNNLSNDLELLKVNLINMNEQETNLTIKEFIKSRKQLAINQSLIPVLNYFSTEASPDLDTLLAGIQADLKPTVEKIMTSRLLRTDLDAYTKKISQLALLKNAEASSMRLLIESFTSEMMGAAKKIKFYLSEKTPVASLPLDSAALGRAFKSSISMLSSENQARLYILIQEKDFAIQKSIWSSMQNKINSDTKNFGVECKPIGFATRTANWGKSFFESDRVTKARESAQRDCDLLNVMATALGLDRQTPFAEFSDIHAALSQKMEKDELETFTLAYRDELTSDLFGEYRLLDRVIDAHLPSVRRPPIDPRIEKIKMGPTSPIAFPKKETKLYEILANAASTESVLPLVRSSIELSLKPLNQHLATIGFSKSEKDLDFFIKRTRIINALLGENDLPKLTTSMNAYQALSNRVSDLMEGQGFVFPNLIDYNAKLQYQMIDDEGVADEVYDEFLTANIYISMGVLGGWAVKHVFGVLPRWTLAPSVASLIQNVGNRSMNLIDGQGWFLMGLIGGHIGTLELKKHEFRTELRHINDLTQSETLKPEGVENPLPLIEWYDYRNQFQYYTEGIQSASVNQLIDLGWLAFPFVMNKAVQQGVSKMASGLVNKNSKFETKSYQDRVAYESRHSYFITHRMKLMRSKFNDIKNPKSLDIVELQLARDQALREAKTTFARNRINESYDQIVMEFGSRLQSVIEHPALLESYSKAMFGKNGTSAQAYSFYQEFVVIAKESQVAL